MGKKTGRNPLKTVRESKSNDDIDGEKDVELGVTQPTSPQHVQNVGGSLHSLGTKQHRSSDNLQLLGTKQHSSSGNLQALGSRQHMSSENLQALGVKQRTRPRRVRMMSTPAGSAGGKGFWASH